MEPTVIVFISKAKRSQLNPTRPWYMWELLFGKFPVFSLHLPVFFVFLHLSISSSFYSSVYLLIYLSFHLFTYFFIFSFSYLCVGKKYVSVSVAVSVANTYDTAP